MEPAKAGARRPGGLGHKPGARGFHVLLDLGDPRADQLAVVLLGDDEFPGQLFDALLVGLVLLLDLLLDPGQPLLDGQRLARGDLLGPQQLRAVRNEFSHQLVLQPLAQVGDETGADDGGGAVRPCLGGQGPLSQDLGVGVRLRRIKVNHRAGL